MGSKIIFGDGSEEAIIHYTKYSDGFIEFATNDERYSLEQLDTLDGNKWFILTKHEILPEIGVVDTHPNAKQVVISGQVYTLGK